MLKKGFIPVVLMLLVFSSLSLAQIDKIAIFNESVGWTTVDVAAAATDYILANVTSAADITVYNDADMGTFAEENTADGNFDIIILFGYMPTSLYPPPNTVTDDSVGEKFLEGGDMFLNTADYIFYVSSELNGDTGLKEMTDSNLDCWVESTGAPTADGGTYTPSYAGAGMPRGFQVAQVEDDPDWELEVAFGESTSGTVDPAIIRNLTYGGRVGIWFQVSDDSLPRGEVAAEMIDNYIAANTTAVEPGSKLTTTWGGLK